MKTTVVQRAALRAPFPWFGGKSRVAPLVWERFGDVRNYVEPFAGSLAVLLGRPTEARVETVNDLECYLANFWRALAADPEQVAHYADWPVNEADLHARHRWLVSTGAERVDRLRTDPEYFDAKIAGWWVWGQCLWIGSGWCKPIGAAHANGTRRELDWAQRPNMSSAGVTSHMRADRNAGRTGVLTAQKRPNITGKGQGVGVNSIGAHVWEKRPELNRGGKGVHRTSNQRPRLDNTIAQGSGMLADAADVKLWEGRANADRNARGVQAHGSVGVLGYLTALSERIRRVRVCCGDWERVVGPAVTTCIGTTGLFLDPPYHEPGKGRSRVYNHDADAVFERVHAWAVAHGNDPGLRIALCGYEGGPAMPEDWSVASWHAAGGYGNSARGRANRKRERIWFSPGCLTGDQHELEGLR